MARSRGRSRGRPGSSRAGTRTGVKRGGSPKIARSRSGQARTASLSSQLGGIGQFGKRGGGYKGFRSKKQWRWAWASGQSWARKKSHETKGGPKIRYRRLPESKHSGRKGSRAPS